MAAIRVNIIMILLFMALLFLQYRLWVQRDGIREVVHLKRTLAVQAVENDKLKKFNEELKIQVAELRGGVEATESRARNELGMIKKGETFYQIVNKDQ